MGRIQSVDVYRVFAIVAVICLHTAAYDGPHAVGRDMDGATFLVNASRFAVPMFFVLAGYFLGRYAAPDVMRASIRTSKRMLLIFLVWSCVYLAVAGVRFSLDNGVAGTVKQLYWTLLEPRTVLLALLEGPKVHLWFLPAFISIVLIAGVLVARGLDTLLLPLGAVLFGLALAGGPYAPVFDLESPINTRNGPFFGMIFFATGFLLQRMGQHPAWLPLGMTLTLAGFALQLAEVQWLHGRWGTSMSQDFVAGTYLFGVGVALVALSNPRLLQLPMVASAGELVLGIYASHYLFIDLMRPLDNDYHGIFAWDLAYVAGVFVLAACATYVLWRYPTTRRFVAP